MGHTQPMATEATAGLHLGWGPLGKTSLKGTGSGVALISEHPQLVPAYERTFKPGVFFLEPLQIILYSGDILQRSRINRKKKKMSVILTPQSCPKALETDS